jgi:hypothetical protein
LKVAVWKLEVAAWKLGFAAMQLGLEGVIRSTFLCGSKKTVKP